MSTDADLRYLRGRLEIHWLDTFVTGPGPFAQTQG